MKIIPIATALAAGWLAIGSAQALSPASQTPMTPAGTGLTEQTQYRDNGRGWGRPGWDRPGYRRGGPRVVCRIVPRQIVNQRTGRIRIVREEVCRRRW